VRNDGFHLGTSKGSGVASVDRPRDNKCRAMKASAKGSASCAFVKSLRMPHFVPCADMDADRMSVSTPICRPCDGPHGGFSVAHESSETTPATVELSGFPTAEKSSPQRWLPFQTERRVRLPDRRARRFLLPRDDIPSGVHGVASRFCRLRLARIVISSRPLS
jgi:hypothetical protein